VRGTCTLRSTTCLLPASNLRCSGDRPPCPTPTILCNHHMVLPSFVVLPSFMKNWRPSPQRYSAIIIRSYSPSWSYPPFMKNWLPSPQRGRGVGGEGDLRIAVDYLPLQASNLRCSGDRPPSPTPHDTLQSSYGLTLLRGLTLLHEELAPLAPTRERGWG
jgi:hypothetical protein